MKKLIAFFLCIVASFSLCACDSSPTTTQGSTDVQKSETATDIKSDLAEQMKVVEYTCVVDDSFRYYVMLITNDSDKVVEVEANITAKGESNINIGAYSDGLGAIAPGQTSCIWTTFDEYDTIKSFDYALTVEETINKPIYSDVTVDYNVTETKVVATATNNGTETASYVWFDVVYLKDGEMVGFSEISLMNADSKLTAGTSTTGEGECYSETGFDTIAVALNGHK